MYLLQQTVETNWLSEVWPSLLSSFLIFLIIVLPVSFFIVWAAVKLATRSHLREIKKMNALLTEILKNK